VKLLTFSSFLEGLCGVGIAPLATVAF